ncbi:MAG: hypothetical protein WAX80_01700 [Minisyncoccia bacterium]
MDSSTSLTTSKGFTLIEIFVVIGIVMVVVTTSMFIDFGSYRGDAFRGEQASLGISLQKARANALNNINQKKHGVAIRPGGYDGYVIFEGDSYATRDITKDEEVEASYGVTFSVSTPSEITFDQLSGNANYSGDITMTDPERGMTGVISTNYEGRISW